MKSLQSRFAQIILLVVTIISLDINLNHVYAEAETPYNNVPIQDGKLQNKITFQESSITGPALAVFNGRLYLAWTGTDLALNVMSSTDGVHFGNKVTLDEYSTASPTLTEFNERLYIGWTGTFGSDNLNVMSSTDGRVFTDKVTLSDTAIDSPSLLGCAGKLYLAWTGIDGDHTLNRLSSTDGINFGDKQTFWGETSIAGPSLICYNRHSVAGLGWVGTDGLHSINVAGYYPPVGLFPKNTLPQQSSAKIGLAMWVGGYELISWVGTWGSNHLNIGYNNKEGTSITYWDDTSIAGPAIAVFNSKTYIAWTGTDVLQSLNIAKVSEWSIENPNPAPNPPTVPPKPSPKPAFMYFKNASGWVLTDLQGNWNPAPLEWVPLQVRAPICNGGDEAPAAGRFKATLTVLGHSESFSLDGLGSKQCADSLIHIDFPNGLVRGVYPTTVVVYDNNILTITGLASSFAVCPSYNCLGTTAQTVSNSASVSNPTTMPIIRLNNSIVLTDVRQLNPDTFQVSLPTDLSPGIYDLWVTNTNGEERVLHGVIQTGTQLYLPLLQK